MTSKCRHVTNIENMFKFTRKPRNDSSNDIKYLGRVLNLRRSDFESIPK